MNTLTVGGVDLTATYGVYVDSSMSFDKPKKNIETVSIPGRNGDLVIDYGTFQNIAITYPCFIKENFDTNYNALMKKLALMSGYQQITCSNDSTHYREGVPIIQQSPTVKRINKDGYFDLMFNCKPQRFLANQSAENIPTTADGTPPSGSLVKDNANGLTLKPTISFKGYGVLRFQVYLPDIIAPVEDITITAADRGTSNPQTLMIDCETMECYRQFGRFTVSQNSYVSFSPNEYPYVPSGGKAYIWVKSGENHFTNPTIDWKEWDL